MITSFNPAVARSNNCRQNNLNFQRGFKKEEIQDLLDGEDDVYNDVRDLIHLNVIKAKDGALDQITLAHKKNTEPSMDRWFVKLTELLKSQK